MTGVNLHLDNTVGCMFIGVLFAVVLYGGGCAQTLYYARAYVDDPLRTKTLVAFMWLLDTARTILDVAVVWEYLVQNHANPSALLILPGTFSAEFFLNSLTVLVVQCYFIHSIWRLLNQKWYRFHLTVAVSLLALLSFAGGCGTLYKAHLNHLLSAVLHNVTIPASIATLTAVITDIYITVSLCLILSAERTGFMRSDMLISMVLMFSIQRGIFTAVVQALHFLTYICTLKKDSLVWMVFHFPASKIYVNSLLAVLNVRRYIREGGRMQVLNETNIPLEVFSQTRQNQRQQPAPLPHGGVVYSMEIVQTYDDVAVTPAQRDEGPGGKGSV